MHCFSWQSLLGLSFPGKETIKWIIYGYVYLLGLLHTKERLMYAVVRIDKTNNVAQFIYWECSMYHHTRGFSEILRPPEGEGSQIESQKLWKIGRGVIGWIVCKMGLPIELWITNSCKCVHWFYKFVQLGPSPFHHIYQFKYVQDDIALCVI